MQSADNGNARSAKRDDAFWMEFIVVGILLILGLMIRLYHAGGPISDLHSWNQASAATVIRNIRRDPATLFAPKWDVLKHDSLERQSGAEEFPVYHAPAALACFSEKYIPVAGRVVSIIASLLGAVFLWRLCRRRFGRQAAGAAMAVYLLSPLGAYFGRAVASDAFSMALSVVALDCFDRYRGDEKKRWFYFGLIALTVSALAKAYQLVCVLPAAYLLMEKDRSAYKKPPLYLILFVPALLTFLWTARAMSLGSMGNVLEPGESFTNNTLFGPLDLLWSGRYWSVLGARLWSELLTPLPLSLAAAGIIAVFIKRDIFMILWLASQGVYLLVVRQGNLIHNYYQLLPLPCLAACAGCGLAAMMSIFKDARKYFIPATAAVAVAMSLTGYAKIRDYHRFDRSSPTAGSMIQRHCDKNSPVIVWEPDRDRKTQTIFYADRRGWFFRRPSPEAIRRHVELGAQCVLVNVPAGWKRNRETMSYLEDNFTILDETKSRGRFQEARTVRLFAYPQN